MLAVTVLIAALGIPPPTNPDAVKLLLSEDLTPLVRPGEARISRVDNFLPPAQKAPPDAESLHFPGIFRVRSAFTPLTPEDAAMVRTVLRKPSSYEPYVTACMFEPAVAFTFPSRSDLLVLICFKCEEVAFAKGRKGLAKFSLTKDSIEELFRLSARIFPDLAKRGHAAEQ
jgi:hypothetical protein